MSNEIHIIFPQPEDACIHREDDGEDETDLGPLTKKVCKKAAEQFLFLISQGHIAQIILCYGNIFSKKHNVVTISEMMSTEILNHLEAVEEGLGEQWIDSIIVRVAKKKRTMNAMRKLFNFLVCSGQIKKQIIPYLPIDDQRFVIHLPVSLLQLSRKSWMLSERIEIFQKSNSCFRHVKFTVNILPISSPSCMRMFLREHLAGFGNMLWFFWEKNK